MLSAKRGRWIVSKTIQFWKSITTELHKLIHPISRKNVYLANFVPICQKQVQLFTEWPFPLLGTLLVVFNGTHSRAKAFLAGILKI